MWYDPTQDPYLKKYLEPIKAVEPQPPVDPKVLEEIERQRRLDEEYQRNVDAAGGATQTTHYTVPEPADLTTPRPPYPGYTPPGRTIRQPEPSGWDPAQYLANNPDVAASGMDPLDHWNRYGQYEGRSYSKPETDTSSLDTMRADFDSQMEKWNSMNAEMAAQIAAMQNYKFQLPEWSMPAFPVAPEPPEVEEEPKRRKSRIRALTLLTEGEEKGTTASKLGTGRSKGKSAKMGKTLLGE